MAASSPGAKALAQIMAVGSLSPPLLERWLPCFGLAAALVACLGSPSLAIGLAPWPFLVAVVVFGLPHGAADGALLLRGLGWPARVSQLAAYLALMALAVAALMAFPTATLVSFLILSWWHFGAADGAELSGGRAPVWLRHAWGFARGGLAVSVPFVADPAAAWAPFARLAELLGGATSIELVWLGRAGAALAALALLALASCTAAPKAARPDLAAWVECGLILALGLAADPLFAVGAYFLMVHGFRQSASLGKELSDGSAAPSLGRRLLEAHRAALPLAVPSWLALIAIMIWVQPAGARDLAVLSLAVYVVATPPHHLLHEVLRRPMGGSAPRGSAP